MIRFQIFKYVLNNRSPNLTARFRFYVATVVANDYFIPFFADGCPEDG